MLQDFTQKKFNDYIAIVKFTEDKITLRSIKESGLPPFIINFIDCTLSDGQNSLSKKEFSQILNKAIVFNINYIIKPKNTLLKFLFGEVETRPVDFIRSRLDYFQFYGYYIDHITDFIDLNSPETISLNQVKHLIDEINAKILAEVNDTSNGDSQRLNLVKLLYYFFHDLPGNNPINIKIPKKILSVYLQDKGFTEIKARVDNFFSDEIFIQEAIDLMNPSKKKSSKISPEEDLSDEKVKDIVTKAKTDLVNTNIIKTNIINKESSNEDVEKTLQPKEELPDIAKIPDTSKLPDITPIREAEVKMPDITDKKVIDDEIYSDDLLLASQINDLIPPIPLTDEEMKEKVINKIFHKERDRKKIIKKLFNKDEHLFKNTLSAILDKENWIQASDFIANFYDSLKIDYYSYEAVKFVDLLDLYFKDKIESSTEEMYQKTGNAS